MEILLHLSTEGFILIEAMVKEYFDHWQPAIDYGHGENGGGGNDCIDDRIIDSIAWLRRVDPNWWAEEIDDYTEDWHYTAPSADCEFFEVIDWDEDTNEIIHAVCTMPSPCWPNCNRCQDKVEYGDVDAPTSNPVLISNAKERLFQTDAELLNNSPNAMVRQEPVDDTEVKRLYDIWKQL